MNRLSKPDFGREEAIALQKALESGWVGPNGPEVRAFENEMEQYLGGEVSVLATNSGTSALHLSLLALGVGPGDLVLVQSYGYCSAAFAVSYVGAKPVFIDSEIDTWGMDSRRLEEALSFFQESGDLGRVKAIIPVHVFGNPADLNGILGISQYYDIPVIEDAAEAIGSSYKGKALGTFGSMGVLSFNANKTLSAGSGGALISKDQQLIERARFLANQARLPADGYQHGDLGYNYAMNALTAALARVQLNRLGELLGRRKALFQFYQQQLAGYYQLQKTIPDAQSNYWLTALLDDNRSQTIQYLKKQDIEVKAGFQPMHLFPNYQGSRVFGTAVSQQLHRSVLLIPSGNGVDEAEVVQYLLSGKKGI